MDSGQMHGIPECAGGRTGDSPAAFGCSARAVHTLRAAGGAAGRAPRAHQARGGGAALLGGRGALAQRAQHVQLRACAEQRGRRRAGRRLAAAARGRAERARGVRVPARARLHLAQLLIRLAGRAPQRALRLRRG